MQKIFIGTSGWNYDHWRGPFYPQGLAKSRWLEYYARIFPSVEVNATFYRSMKPTTFDRWRQATPDGFLWSIKANRFITHMKRLKDAADPVKSFLESMKPLETKHGPVLFQLPPSLAFDKGLMRSFCSLLPEGKRYSLETRHESWMCNESLSCFRDFGIAWCISDTAGRYPYLETVTAGFTYIRLHGSRSLYASCYTEEELGAWAAKIRDFGVDAYVYFDNDFMGYAPLNALRLMEILS
jgi:uncharacterized protein YecE (DUF72 family)